METLIETAPHPDWPSLSTYIYAAVERHHGWKPCRYMADCCLDLVDRDRTQHNVARVFATDAEAEAHARLFWDVMLPVWRESLRTRTLPESPFTRQRQACAAHVLAATQAERWALGEAEKIEGNSRAAYAAVSGARDDLRKAEYEAERAFYAANPWESFR